MKMNVSGKKALEHNLDCFLQPEYMQAKFEALGKETVELIESRSHTENVPDTQAIASLEGSLPSY